MDVDCARKRTERTEGRFGAFWLGGKSTRFDIVVWSCTRVHPPKRQELHLAPCLMTLTWTSFLSTSFLSKGPQSSRPPPPAGPPTLTPVTPANRALAAPAASRRTAAPRPAKKIKKTEKPHVLLRIATNGKGRGRVWKQKALRVIGVYADKLAAETKKEQLMEKSDCCGHGDILVGGSWEDEIDLVVRPIEEVQLGE